MLLPSRSRNSDIEPAESQESETRVACPICYSDSTRCFERNRIWIRQCRRCSHRFADVKISAGHAERVYGDNYFHGGGAGYNDYLSEQALLQSAGRRYARLLLKSGLSGRSLDVGGAAGVVASGFREEGWDVEILEPNRSMALYAQDTLGFKVHNVTLEGAMLTGRYDLVTMIQVIAHFFDLRGALTKVREVLVEGGHLLVETWDSHSVTARALGSRWHEYSPPSVLHYFHKTGLRRMLAEYGFSLVAEGRPRKFISVGHIRSLLGWEPGRYRSKLMARFLPDSLEVRYPGTDLFWMLFRKGPLS